VDRKTYTGFDFPGADDFPNMNDFLTRYKPFIEKRDPKLTKELNPDLLSIRAWEKAHKKELRSVAPK